jgi:uncharacterized protein YcbK (DUF882 family)
MPFHTRSVVSLALTLLPAIAAAAPHAQAKPHHGGRSAVRPTRGPHLTLARAMKESKPRACLKEPIEIVTGTESATLSLAKCDGAASPPGLERLSMLARAPGAHRLDARLVERLELAVDHFRKPTESARIQLVSGYRPRSAGSYHATGRALDFRIVGIENEALIAFCKTLPDTGCGYYPNSLFVHMDVREPGTGHIAWTDLSRPGEPPRYVTKDAAVPTLPALPAGRPDAREQDPKLMTSDHPSHSISHSI